MRWITTSLAAVLFLGACGRPADSTPPRESGSHPGSTGEASVELSPSQLSAITIEPVGTHRFSLHEEAVGTIGFDEDPAIVQAESTLVAAAATFVLTRKTLARARQLYGANGGVAQRELEQAVSDHQAAAAALESARDALRALGKTGAEIDRLISSGRIGSAPATKWAVAKVAESDSPLLRLGQPVVVKALAYPDRAFDGTISKIYATVDPNTHRVTIRCPIADPGDALRAGMLASVSIRVQGPLEATALPTNAVVREGDGTMTAWVTTDRHRFVQRPLRLGLQADGQYQVLDGVQRGELAVTDGAVFLSNLLNAPPSD